MKKQKKNQSQKHYDINFYFTKKAYLEVDQKTFLSELLH